MPGTLIVSADAYTIQEFELPDNCVFALIKDTAEVDRNHPPITVTIVDDPLKRYLAAFWKRFEDGADAYVTGYGADPYEAVENALDKFESTEPAEGSSEKQPEPQPAQEKKPDLSRLTGSKRS